MSTDPELERLLESRDAAEQRWDDLREDADWALTAASHAEHHYYDAEDAYDKYKRSLKPSTDGEGA